MSKLQNCWNWTECLSSQNNETVHQVLVYSLCDESDSFEGWPDSKDKNIESFKICPLRGSVWPETSFVFSVCTSMWKRRMLQQQRLNILFHSVHSFQQSEEGESRR